MKTLAAQVAQQVRTTLKEQYPAILISVKAKKWRTGGMVAVAWTDGPTVQAIAAVLQPHIKAHEGNIFVDTERSFSAAFLTNVVAAYCRDTGYALPEIRRNKDGSAYVAPTSIGGVELHLHIWREAMQIDEQEVKEIAFAFHPGDNVVERSRLVVRKDHSQGKYAGYAIIGQESSLKMSQTFDHFEIVKVVVRLGPHRVKIVETTFSGLAGHYSRLRDACSALEYVVHRASKGEGNGS